MKKALLGLLLFSCSSDSVDPGPQEVTFEKEFLWGSASAAFQVEKGITGTDWSKWVETPGKIKNGDKPDVGGADALAHIDEDVALLVATAQNSYRFSIEWTRIYPTKDAFDADQADPAGVAAYDHLFDALAKAHITPMVTLQHFTMPSWLADPAKPNDPQGWERPESIDQFGAWCGRAAKRWGAQVEWWATINEPIVVPLGGYVQGSFPPGIILAVDRALLAAKNEVRAHAKCYDAVKAADPSSMVGIVHHLRAVEPKDPTDKDDVAAAERVRYFNNTWFLNAVVRGDFDDDFDQKYDGPNDRKADPALVNRSDYLGINYYTSILASASGLVLPVVNAASFDVGRVKPQRVNAPDHGVRGARWGRRDAGGQRDRPAGAQFRPLDHRRGDRLAVRAAYPGGRRLDPGAAGPPRPGRDAQPDRGRGGGCCPLARCSGRLCPPLPQG